MNHESPVDCHCAELADVAEITRVKMMYFRAVDERRYDDLFDLFTDDAVVTRSDSPPDTAAALIEALRRNQQDSRVVHLGVPRDITVTGSDTAAGSWLMTFYLEGPGGAREGVWGFRTYEDTYRREGDVWRIASSRVSDPGLAPMVAVPRTAE